MENKAGVITKEIKKDKSSVPQRFAIPSNLR
jgi:hypothetical protein